MKTYLKLGLTVMLLALFVTLSGFRAQTIIHDDGSETQDVLKVSQTVEGQKALRTDAEDFGKRNYTVMDYSNENGEGFRAMKTITKDGANKSSVDHIVHKTHDGIICSTYYIDYKYDENSIKTLRLGLPMDENGADLEYMVSFPSGTNVKSNSTHVDNQGSTYMWSLKNSSPMEIQLQATVWHKLFIYLALFIIIAIVIIVLIMEHRRKSVISWKRAAHLRRLEMMLLFIPIVILAYMGYEYYVGTHITADSLAKVSQQQQEELLENREEDKRLQNADNKKRSGERASALIRSKANEISGSLRELNRDYQSGRIGRSTARQEAEQLAAQAREMLSHGSDLSEADREVLQQLVDSIVEEADSIGSGPSHTEETTRERVVEEERRAEAVQETVREVQEEERAVEQEVERAAADRSDDRQAETKSNDSAKDSSTDSADSSESTKGTEKIR